MLIRRSKKLLRTGLQGLFLFVFAFIAGTAALADVSGGTNDPKLLFEKMLLAKTTVVYTGSLAYERGDQLFSYSIASDNQASADIKTLVSLNGSERTYELVNASGCLHDFVNSVEDLADWYNFSYVGPTRVAGRHAHEITLSPVDPYRLGHSFVVDQDTGLLLRSVTMLPDRRVLERVEFLELGLLPGKEENALIAEEETAPITDETDATETTLVQENDGETAQETQVQDFPVEPESCEQDAEPSDWVLNWVPEGFQLVTETQPPNQYSMIYSDGISTFSLFVEPVAQLGLPIGSTHRGATLLAINYYAAAGTTYMITFVGEVPLASAERVLNNLDKKL